MNAYIEKGKIYGDIWGYDKNSKKLAERAFKDGYLEAESEVN